MSTDPNEPESAASGEPRCLVADDHLMLLTLLQRYLTEEGVNVVATATRGQEALDKLTRIVPDVAVLDFRMPELDGLEVAHQAATACPQVGIVLFTGFGERTLLSEALDVGIRGFVQKDASVHELVRAIRTVASGGTFVDPVLGAGLVMGATGDERPALSRREREVLRLLADGLRNREIGERLLLSPDTVRSYTGRAMQKLGADTRTQAVATAIQQSIIA